MISQHYTVRLKLSSVWPYEKGMKMGFPPEWVYAEMALPKRPSFSERMVIYILYYLLIL